MGDVASGDTALFPASRYDSGGITHALAAESIRCHPLAQLTGTPRLGK